MDRLSEIRARCERAQRDDYTERIYGCAAYYCVYEDIPYLLDRLSHPRIRRKGTGGAEVIRITIDIDDYGDPMATKEAVAMALERFGKVRVVIVDDGKGRK